MYNDDVKEDKIAILKIKHKRLLSDTDNIDLVTIHLRICFSRRVGSP